ncbi:MAG: hypothetical protein ACXVZX_11375 [Terriglobales bacterium]
MPENWRGFVKGFVGRLVVSSLVSVVIVVALIMLAGYTFTLGMCGNSVAREVPSPDGKWKAVIYERDCGATTDFSTQVSVLEARDDVGDESGNVFITDSNHGAVPISGIGVINVDVLWRSNSEVRVRYPSAARVFKKETRISGVSVSYETE